MKPLRGHDAIMRYFETNRAWRAYADGHITYAELQQRARILSIQTGWAPFVPKSPCMDKGNARQT